MQGRIMKLLGGFYYVERDGEIFECRARGRFRYDEEKPLVGDRVEFSEIGGGKGVIEKILPRKNFFVRPSVANIDLLVIIASQAIPSTDPYLIDRVTVACAHNASSCAVVINKCDLDRGDRLFDIYSKTGIKTLRTSATTNEGIDELRELVAGKVCVFTGNSGVGKSSILNALEPGLELATGEISQKLGRGRHTTRHVELVKVGDMLIADTPGFSSFDSNLTELVRGDELQYAFTEFEPYLGQCRFRDCAHIKEPDCAVLQAVETGIINKTRHDSYVRMYELAFQVKEWEL